MRHASRMLLIPEDFFKSLMGSERLEEKTNSSSGNDGTSLGLIRERLQNARDNSKLDPDTQAINYEQNFKRYNKLVREKEEKPIDVKLKNIGEISDKILNNYNEKVLKPPQNIKANKLKKTVQIKNLNRKSIAKVVKKPSKPFVDKNIKVDEPEFFSADDEEGKNAYELNLSEKALKYIKENSESLGITPDLRLARKLGGNYPFITSNVEEIINYIIKNNGDRIRPLPTGYDEFIRRIDNHTFLKNLLFPPGTSTGQTGSGVFSFKPVLWKNYR